MLALSVPKAQGELTGSDLSVSVVGPFKLFFWV